MLSTRLVLSAAAVVALSAIGPAARAVDFHFTATADMRQYHSYFSDLCGSINHELGGPGVFHVSIGDIDGRVWDNRAVIDDNFGESAIWYPIIGNHEAEDGIEMEWLRDEYDNGNGERTPLKEFTNQDGPTGTVRLNYTWDYENVHFVALNQYWSGGTNEGNGTSLSGSDTARDGDVVPALYNWLAADLAANTRPLVIVFGHEPAFPQYRHVGDSLDKYPVNRDAFWQLLEDNNVVAFLNGHTHVYYRHQGDKNGIGNTWQIDLGNAGNDTEGNNGYTYADIRVTDYEVTFDIWRDVNKDGTYALSQSWTESVPSRFLTWDQLGAGNWGDSRWVGDVPPDIPDPVSVVEVKTDTVTVAADGSARVLTLTSGAVVIDPGITLTVSQGVDVALGTLLDVAGTLTAQSLTSAGTTTIANAATLSVSQGVEIAAGAALNLAGTLNAQSLTTAGAHAIAPGAILSISDSLTVDSTLDLTAATLNTTPHVTNVQVNPGGQLSLGQVLRAGQLGVTGMVHTAGADLSLLSVAGSGLVTSSADVTAEQVNLTGGTVQLSGGANLYASTMRLDSGTVDTGTGHVEVSQWLKIGQNTTVSTAGTTVQVSGCDLADPAQPSCYTLSGGTVTLAGGATAPMGAIATWRFEEGTGPTAADTSTAGDNNHPGAISGPTWVTDDPQHGTVLRFNGGTDYVQAANIDDIKLGDPFTVAMWIKTTQLGGKLLAKGAGDNWWWFGEKALYINNTTGRITFSGFSPQGQIVGTTNVADDRWHHVAVTYGKSLQPGGQEIYVDGQLDTSSRSYNGYNSGTVFRLGWAETGDAGGFLNYQGLMDDVYIYDRLLSPLEVAELYGAFGSELQGMPASDFLVTADSILLLETDLDQLGLRDLAVQPGVNLTITGAAATFRDVTAGEASSITGDISVGRTLSPGDSPGTLSVIGNLEMDSGSTYRWELGASAADLIEVTGQLTLSGDGWTLKLIDDGAGTVPSGDLPLFAYGNLADNPLGNWMIDTTEVPHWVFSGGGPWLANDPLNHRVLLGGLIALPEPGTMVLVATALAGLLAGAVRKRRPYS